MYAGLDPNLNSTLWAHSGTYVFAYIVEWIIVLSCMVYIHVCAEGFLVTIL